MINLFRMMKKSFRKRMLKLCCKKVSELTKTSDGQKIFAIALKLFEKIGKLIRDNIFEY